jgi:hypothetical protein
MEHKSFLIVRYFRNGTNFGRVWVYLVQNCIEEFEAEFKIVLMCI